MLIGLSGYARSGKDTVAAILVEHGFRRVSFADKLRDVVLAVNPVVHLDPLGATSMRPVRLAEIVERSGWEGAKTGYPEVRRLLQSLGTAVRDSVDSWVWIKAALHDVDIDENVVISDVRFCNEAEAIRARGGRVVRVTRPGFGPVNGHVSECDLDDWPFDDVIANTGTLEDLASTAAGLHPLTAIQARRHRYGLPL